MINKITRSDKILVLVLILILSVSLGCGRFATKPLIENEVALNKELRNLVTDFFVHISTNNKEISPELDYYMVETELQEAIKKSLALTPGQLLGFDHDQLDITVELEKLQGNNATARISGEITSLELTFDQHLFTFVKDGDRWLIANF